MYKLRTIDVWDTLLRRACHPECIKVIVAHHVFLKYRDQLCPHYADHWAIYRARLDVELALAEEAIRAGGDGEYDVNDVVRRWLELIAPDASKTDAVGRLVEYEFHVEATCTSADEDVQAVLAAYPAEKTIFLSDFYWPSDMLRRLLHDKGLSSVVAEGISSCDVGLNKRSGRLFQHILEVYRVEPSAVVHIGDNPHSDVNVARARGIHAVHFQPGPAHRSRIQRESLFSRRESLFADARAQTRVACEQHLKASDPDQAAAFHAGAELAPLFVGFSLFVAEKAIQDSVDRLFFLMREGAFLKRVFEAVHVETTYRGHALPRASLLAVSRASTAFAGTVDPVRDIIDGHCWPYRGHPLAALIDAIGVDRDFIRMPLDQSGLSVTDLIADATKDQRVRALLVHPDVRRAALQACAVKREHLVAYLQSKGFLQEGRYATVDIGWRGTIQDNIGRLGVAARLEGYYLALNKQLTPSPVCCGKAAYLVDESMSAEHLALLDSYALMEMICAADSGTTTHYQWSGDCVVPVLAAGSSEVMSINSVIRNFQDGVVFGCGTWAPLVLRYGCSASDLVPVAVQSWYRIMTTPPHVIVDAFREVLLDDPCSSRRVMRPRDVPSLQTLVAACWDKRAGRDVSEYVTRIRWPQALTATKCWSSRRIDVGITRGLLLLGSLFRRGKCAVRHVARSVSNGIIRALRCRS